MTCRFCTFFSPSPTVMRVEAASICWRNAGSNHAPGLDVDHRHELVVAGRDAGERELTIGRRPGRSDAPRLRDPVSFVGRIENQRLLGRGLAALIGDRAGELRLLIGERDHGAPGALPGFTSNGKSSVSWPSMMDDSIDQPLPAPDAVNR